MSILACRAAPAPSHSGIRWSRWKAPQCTHAMLHCWKNPSRGKNMQWHELSTGGKDTERDSFRPHVTKWGWSVSQFLCFSLKKKKKKIYSLRPYYLKNSIKPTEFKQAWWSFIMRLCCRNWGREVGRGIRINLLGCSSMFKRDLFHKKEKPCFVTLLHTSIYHITLKKHSFIVRRFVLSFSFLFFSPREYTRGSSLPPSIIVIRGSHMLAKLNAKQMFLFQATFYHTVKVHFSEMWNKMNLLYKIL